MANGEAGPASQLALLPPTGLRIHGDAMFADEAAIPGKSSLDGFVDDHGNACIVKDAPELQPHFGTDPIPSADQFAASPPAAWARGRGPGQPRGRPGHLGLHGGSLRVLREADARMRQQVRVQTEVPAADADEFGVVDEVYDALDRFERENLLPDEVGAPDGAW